MEKPNFIIPEEKEMDEELLFEFINKHKSYLSTYSILEDMYNDNHSILKLPPKERYKPDNRIIANFSRYITNTFNGFFIGIPIMVSHEDEEINKYLNFIDGYNNQDDTNSEISKLCSIFGHAYELIYNDEEGKIGLTYIKPSQCFIIYDNSIRKKPLYGIRYFINEDNKIEGTYSDKNKIVKFIEGDKGISFTEEEFHLFDDVPIIEYVENEEKKGIFESVMTMIDAYNKAISEKANDVDYYADSYLVVLGAYLEDESLKRFRDSRTINLVGDEADKVVVDFLTKPSSDETQENLLDRLERLIFQISMVSNISDKNFTESSGVAMKYKLQPMENLAVMKERKFIGSLNRRYKVISSFPSSPMKGDDWVNIQYRFNRKLPSNLLEESQIARNLSGVTSDETTISVLSIVNDAKEEMDKRKKETEDSGMIFQRRLEGEITEHGEV